MLERMSVVSIGLFLDLLFGDPHWLYHPVQGIGAVIKRTEMLLWKIFRLGPGKEEDSRKKKAAGVILVCIVLLWSVGIPAAVLFLAKKIQYKLYLGIEAVMCYQLLAMHSLKKESMKVYKALRALREGTLEKARYAVSMIVGRDTDCLDEEGIIRAAVETVAENTSDGVIAPLLFLILFGPLGGFFYKAVNTMDSMIGYKNEKYYYFGWAAAKLDDALNLIPSRVAAVAMIAASFLCGMNWKNAVRIYRRDRFKHSSPNAAQTESVCAGALSVRLAGDAFYFGELYHKPEIGDALRRIEAEDIRRANRLLYAASFLVWGVAVLSIAAIYCWQTK